jgi:hypothetical protein
MIGAGAVLQQMIGARRHLSPRPVRFCTGQLLGLRNGISRESSEVTHLFRQDEWRRLSSLRFCPVFAAFRRLESLRHSFRKTLGFLGFPRQKP